MEKETLQSALAEFPQVPTVNINNVKTFLAVMANGSIQQMSKENMASVLGELLPEATPTNDGLMSKYKAVMQLTNSSWHEITGEGTFIVSLEHPIKTFASIYICILNGFSAGSSAVVSDLFVGSENTLKIKSKQETSNTPKVYVKSANYVWIKIIPLSGNISVKITTDVVE